MKYYCLFLLVMLHTAVVAQTMRQNYARQKYESMPQPAAQMRKADTAVNRMPVLKPDTARMEKMPVIKPPANVQPK